LRFAYEPSVFRETALGGADGGAARAASEASRQQTCTGRNARVKSAVVAQMPGGGNSASGLVPSGVSGRLVARQGQPFSVGLPALRLWLHKLLSDGILSFLRASCAKGVV